MLMRIDCANLQSIVHNLPLVRSCDTVRSGALRMSTPFLYPNGEYVDLFLYSQHQLLDSYKLSDFGQTSQYLRSAMVTGSSTSRKKEIIHDITSQLDVSFAGDLYINLGSEDMDSISDAIMRLSQACVRISDIATHQRLRSSNPFRDDIEDFIDAQNLAYTPDAKVVGKYGKDIRLDFEVRSTNRFSYLNVLGAISESAAHASANEISLKWKDLIETGHLGSHKLITVINSFSNAVQDADMARLRDLSDVVAYPEQHDFLAHLLIGDKQSQEYVEVPV